MAYNGSRGGRAQEPLISVIVPVYNVEKYLERCLGSLLGQTHRQMEFLLVNDGSTDASGEICDRFAAKDSRIKVIHQKNAGVSAARNAGLEAAKGEYIGFCDPDDYVEPDMYEYLLKLLQSEKADIAVCSGWYEYKRDILRPFGSRNFVSSFSGMEAIRQLYGEGHIRSHVYDKLYRRQVWEGTLFSTELSYGEDHDITCRILEKGVSIVCGPERKYHYIQRASGANGKGYGEGYQKYLQMREFYKERYIKKDPAHRVYYENSYFRDIMWVMRALCRDREYRHPDGERFRSFIREHLWEFIRTEPASFLIKAGGCVLCVSPRLFGVICLLREKRWVS
ncbi:MAG: glycosyltransferase [Provencibacterium sp.]|jgi:glycosyltransferase involved in cell wall biosynthesis|nr:glycosyltransferase [Provencibacterium sp.]